MKNNFVDLLKYTALPASIAPVNEEDAAEELRYYLQHIGEIYDIINYEKIIYIELNFPKSDPIQKLISDLKNEISINYINKHKLIQKLNKTI